MIFECIENVAGSQVVSGTKTCTEAFRFATVVSLSDKTHLGAAIPSGRFHWSSLAVMSFNFPRYVHAERSKPQYRPDHRKAAEIYDSPAKSGS